MNLHIALYIDNNYEHKKNRKNIEETMSQEFGGMATLFASENIKRIGDDGGINASEVLVFSIRKPVIKEPEHISQFFRKLELVFDMFSDHFPHFTQESKHVDYDSSVLQKHHSEKYIDHVMQHGGKGV